MEKTTANNDISLYNEITLKEFFQLVLSSKKILLLITLLTTVVLTSYVYFLKPTMFEADAKIVIGKVDEKALIDLTKIERIMRFHFKSDFEFIPFLNQYLELKIQSSSEDNANSEINLLTQYIFEASEQNFNNMMLELNASLNNAQNNIKLFEDKSKNFIKLIDEKIKIVDEQIKIIDDQLIDSKLDSKSIVQLKIQKKNLETEKAILKNNEPPNLRKRAALEQIETNTLEKINAAVKSSFYEPVKVSALDKKEFFYIVFGFFLGLALSVIIVILRRSYSTENK